MVRTVNNGLLLYIRIIILQVQGIGPIFKLTVTIQNTSLSSPAINLYLAFKCDGNLYDIDKNIIKVY